MRKVSACLVAFGGCALIGSLALAEPVKLLNDQLDGVVAGAITSEQFNGGGKTPNGNANGVPTTNVNPTGKAPAGQNK
jgi:hypothetical protein